MHSSNLALNFLTGDDSTVPIELVIEAVTVISCSIYTCVGALLNEFTVNILVLLS